MDKAKGSAPPKMKAAATSKGKKTRFHKALYTWYKTPVISSAAPPSVRKIIAEGNWKDEVDLSIDIVTSQLDLHKKRLDARQNAPPSGKYPELESAREKFGIDPLADVKTVADVLGSADVDAQRAFWENPEARVPFVSLIAARNVLPAALGHAEGGDGDSEPPAKRARRETADIPQPDIDEWVIRNERVLRDTVSGDWRYGLVNYSEHASLMFGPPAPESTSRVLAREPREDISGFTFLDDKRSNSIEIQPSLESFAETFHSISDGLFDGLDWNNVFVAGGMILGSLLSVTPEAEKQYQHSDIDVYIYGLNPLEANEKIRHIYATWKKNLPEGAPSGIVRNSRTISLFSSYPTKRVQIVLKIVKSPRDVLLNFDLDIASVGWDGKELWLLPRAVRALQTGYNVFTMNLVHGHFLGDRRASQESRVFKYADRRYGIRILPGYLDKLRELVPSAKDIRQGEPMHKNFNPANIAQSAEKWVQTFLNYEFPLKDPNNPPKLSHAKMYRVYYKTTEPLGRDCLTSFERMMRHYYLWKQGIAGRVTLDNTVFASTDYDMRSSPLSYDDAPQKYAWNKDFTLKGLRWDIERINDLEREILGEFSGFRYLTSSEYEAFDKKIIETIQRSSYGDNLDDILGAGGDFTIPILIPVGCEERLISFANKMLLRAFEDHGLPFDREPLELLYKPTKSGPLAIALWHINAVTAWQQIDRRIDEVYEQLWSFHFGNATVVGSAEDRFRVFVTHLSKRTIRDSLEEEYDTFLRWVGRRSTTRQSWDGAWGWDNGGASGKLHCG